MKKEFSIGLLLMGISYFINRFGLWPGAAIDFVQGVMTSLGMLLMVIAHLPEKTYNRLLYRKLLAKSKNS